MSIPVLSDYELNAEGESLDRWPPLGLDARIDYLNELYEAYVGGAVKWCKMTCIRLGNILTSTLPAIPNYDASGVVFNSIVDMVRYGHALILPNPEHRDGAEVLDPRYWAPLADGSWVYLLPMAGGSGDIISALVYVWFDGTLYVTRREFNGSVVGPIIEELGQTQTPELLIAQNLPKRGMYGTSIVEMGEPWQAQAEARSDGLSDYAKKVENPLLARVADSDLGALGVDTDQDLIEEAEEASEILSKLDDMDVKVFPDVVANVKYEGPDPSGLDVLDRNMERIRHEFEVATGFTDVRMDRAMDGAFSGVALKWSHWQTYQLTLSLQNQLEEILEEIYGTSLEWPSPFDQIEEVADESNDPTPGSA